MDSSFTFRDLVKDLDEESKRQLENLKLEDVECTGKELGRGAYGVVSELIINGLRCAGKTLHQVFFAGSSASEQDSMRRRFVEECVQHAGLRHPNIVQLMGIHFSPGDLVPTMVLEFLHDSLYHFLISHSDVDVPFKRRILLDVAVGLRFLHERAPPIIHRDLTPKNVLLTEDLRAKISDLGVARIVPPSLTAELTKAPGNVEFMPPEALVPCATYGSKLDIFSLGSLILFTVLQKWPSPDKGPTSPDPNKKGAVIAHTEVERRECLFVQMDPTDPLTALAKDCLDNDPGLRPTSQQVHALLEPLVGGNSGAYLQWSSLEWFQRHKKLKKENAECKRHSQTTACRVNKLLLDLSGKTIVEGGEVEELIGQLYSVLLDTQLCRNVLDSSTTTTTTTTTTYSQRHKIVLGLQPAHSESAHSSPSSPSSPSSEDLVHLRSFTGSPHPVSLTLGLSVSHTFSGRYVKTVISSLKNSGLMKCTGVASKNGFLYVVDEEGWKGIHICNVETGDVRSIVDSAGPFEGRYRIPVEKCWYPSGVTVDDEGNIILADKSNHRIAKYDKNGDFLLASREPVAGNKVGMFNEPLSLCKTQEGKIIVCDWKNHRIQVLNSDLKCERTFGKMGRGKGLCDFFYPRDVAVDSKGNIYVVDCGNFCVKVFNPNFEFLRKFGRDGNTGDGFRWPNYICIDKRDYVYVTDRTSNCVKIFDPNGVFRMEFGGKASDPDEFKFQRPTGIAVDEHGHVFVSDSNNRRVVMFE